ncbi:glycoside hydrolase superfamily [Polychytrium aggregatum]|uniref:glycoside hydrolase superfamily n=1 Tax=Polychytrium aggregatum TaxID=110093 RepID=UPI0022FDE0D3|nr:glycoside hydrolase superfamily [Polychytrium aggregatum]KAI9206918.1 glycoside hydrolase superfamily [Polychytrium aggregatum]
MASTTANPYDIIPQPVLSQFVADQPPFRLDRSNARLAFAVPDDYPDLVGLTQFLAYFASFIGLAQTEAVAISELPSVEGSIVVELLGPDSDAHSQPNGNEGYDLSVDASHIRIRSRHIGGARHGLYTFAQMTDVSSDIAAGVVVDQPRFAWRGVLLDCCRSFMDIPFILSLLDILAYHKVNRLHWHLTEDQGWRIQIDRFPRLTEVGAWRYDPTVEGGQYGGYYTKDDIRAVVDKASLLGITIVPEIELPGHSLAALASYPELGCIDPETMQHRSYATGNLRGIYDDCYCAGQETTFEFLQAVIDEVIPLFPGDYFHFGGDEVTFRRWYSCPLCTKRMADHGFTTPQQLQSWFVSRMAGYISSKGKIPIGWDDIVAQGADDLPRNVTIQSWLGPHGVRTAVKSGLDVVVSPYTETYFDLPALPQNDPKDEGTAYHWSVHVPFDRVYNFDPCLADLTDDEQKHIIGVECCLWTERARQAVALRKLFPRILAFATKAWFPKPSDPARMAGSQEMDIDQSESAGLLAFDQFIGVVSKTHVPKRLVGRFGITDLRDGLTQGTRDLDWPGLECVVWTS